MAKLQKTTRWDFEQWFYEHSGLANEKIKSLVTASTVIGVYQITTT